MRFVPIFLVLIGIILLVGGLWKSNNPTYSGKEVFYLESEYIEFKEACAQEDVRIEDVKELSSSLPIIVDFKVTSPKEFPYGKKDLESVIAMIVLGSVSLVAAAVTGISDVIMDRRIKEVN